MSLALGAANWQLRLPALGFGVLFLLAVFMLGRAVVSEQVGAWAALVIAGTHSIVLRNVELLSDMPAATLCLFAVALLIVEFQRSNGPSWRLLGCAPLFALAFYLRYGVGPMVAIVGVVALLVWARVVARSPYKVLAAGGLLAGLLLPHFLLSLHWTGQALGILRVSSGMPRQLYVGDGLVTYLTSNPFLFYGVLTAPVMVSGVLSLAGGRLGVAPRPVRFLVGAALAQMVVLGLQTHGQPRYVFLAIVLLVVAGVTTLFARLSQPRYRVVATAVVSLAIVGNVVAATLVAKHIARLRAPVVATAGAIKRDAAMRGQACMIVTVSTAQLAWYSGCAVRGPNTIVEADFTRYKAVYFASVPPYPSLTPASVAHLNVQARVLTEGEQARVWSLTLNE